MLLLQLLLLLLLQYSNAIIKLRDDNGDIVSTIKITTYGSKNIISSITNNINNYNNINNENNDNNNILLYNNNNKYVIINNLDEDIYDNNSDIAIINMPKDAHLNDDKLLHRIQCGISSLLSLEGESKSTLIMLLPENSDNDYEKLCLSTAKGAWAMMINRESYRHPDLTQEINVIITTTTKLTMLNTLLDSKYELDNNDDDESVVENLSSYVRNLSKKNDDSSSINSKKQSATTMNMEVYQEAIDQSLEWVRTGIKESLVKLRQTTGPEKGFAVFVDNLLKGAIDKFTTKTDSSDLTKAMITLGKDNITKETLLMMAPFFRHQISLVRQESIKFFNTAAVDEIAISVKIIDDLSEAKRKAIKKFTSDINDLIPKAARSSWDISFEVYQLNDIFDDYIEGRRIQSQLQGVLPRGRKPIDISMHYFLNHPFGRDYRQDPLGFNEKDKIVFEKSLVDSKDVLVHPDLARPTLVEQAKVDSFAQKYGRRNLQSDSEFAREMLMFPLSIKNPSVPLMSGRSRRRGGPPKKDATRESSGPERFIAWDIKPMDTIKKNLDQYIQASLSSSSSSKQSEIVDKIINVIPAINQGFYSHPSINYGPKYASSSSSYKRK